MATTDLSVPYDQDRPPEQELKLNSFITFEYNLSDKPFNSKSNYFTHDKNCDYRRSCLDKHKYSSR